MFIYFFIKLLVKPPLLMKLRDLIFGCPANKSQMPLQEEAITDLFPFSKKKS
jgi:hypothetical protein